MSSPIPAGSPPIIMAQNAFFHIPNGGGRGAAESPGVRGWFTQNIMMGASAAIQNIAAQSIVGVGQLLVCKAVQVIYGNPPNEAEDLQKKMLQTALKINALAGKEEHIIDENGNVSLFVLQAIAEEQDSNVRNVFINGVARCVAKNLERREAEKKLKEIKVRVSWYSWIYSSAAKIFQNLFRPVSSLKISPSVSSRKIKLGSSGSMVAENRRS